MQITKTAIGTEKYTGVEYRIWYVYEGHEDTLCAKFSDAREARKFLRNLRKEKLAWKLVEKRKVSSWQTVRNIENEGS